MDIKRTGGFPLCAETLGILDENSRMLAEWLKQLPLKNRQAVMLGGGHLLVCHNLQKKVVKVDSNSAASISQCRLDFRTTNKNVEDSNGNTFHNVWMEERADIVDETNPGSQWTIMSPWDVLELKLWYDHLPAFEAGLPGGYSVATQVGETPSHGLDRITSLTLYGDVNELVANDERARIKVAVRYQGQSTAQHVLWLPLPFGCPDGVRMDADVEMSGRHYPIEVYTDGGALMVCVGRWLSNENLIPDGSLTANCDAIIRINKEVVL